MTASERMWEKVAALPPEVLKSLGGGEHVTEALADLAINKGRFAQESMFNHVLILVDNLIDALCAAHGIDPTMGRCDWCGTKKVDGVCPECDEEETDVRISKEG